MKRKGLLLIVLAGFIGGILFSASVYAGDCGECPGTGTPGYWKNHPDAWPVEVIVVGCVSYSKDAAINIMKMSVSKDKTITLFKALVAAKLNVAAGCKDCCVADCIECADSLLCEVGVLSGQKASSDFWQGEGGGSCCNAKGAEYYYLCLDDYNNGLLCEPARD